MSHVVHHVPAGQDPVWERVGSLQDALSRVEALQHRGNSRDVQVFQEVPIQIETIYRVHLIGAEQPAPRPAVAATRTPLADADVEVIERSASIGGRGPSSPLFGADGDDHRATIAEQAADAMADDDEVAAAVDRVLSEVSGPPSGSAFLAPGGRHDDQHAERRGSIFGR